MATAAPQLPDVPTPVAPEGRRKKPIPGLTPAVVIVAAVCFFMLMGSGSVVLVQTLKATEEKTDEWPVARKRLGLNAGAADVRRMEGGTPTPGGVATGQALSDLPAEGEIATADGRARVMMPYGKDQWLHYFPGVSEFMEKRADADPQSMQKLLNGPKTGSLGWAMYDPASPFKWNMPRTRLMEEYARQRAAYEIAAKAGFPEDTESGIETEQEKQQAAAAEAARQKKRKALQAHENATKK